MAGEVLIAISAGERMRMKAIQLDNDREDALAMVKLLLSRIEEAERREMKPHIG